MGYVLFRMNGICDFAAVDAHYTYYVVPSMTAERVHCRRRYQHHHVPFTN
jgi:hypothetical protein